jgi:hypothetical protein
MGAWVESPADPTAARKFVRQGNVRFYGHLGPGFCGVRLFNSTGRETGYAAGDPPDGFLSMLRIGIGLTKVAFAWMLLIKGLICLHQITCRNYR